MSELAVISIDKELSPIKEKNLYFTTILSNFIWMIFHFTVVFFFTFQLKSIALVWIFLWIWNFFALILDISIWVITKYFKAKTLYIFSYVIQILSMLIFAYFIYQTSNFINNLSWPWDWIFNKARAFFLWQWLNIFLLLVTSFFYWLSKELQEVTIFSYILNNSNLNQYSFILARKNLWSGIWAFFWLVTSWLVLSFKPNLIIIVIVILIFIVILYTQKYFDNPEKSIDFWNISKFKVLFNKKDFNNLSNDIKNTIVKSVWKVEINSLVNTSKYIFLKPAQKKETKINLKSLIELTKSEFITTFNIFKSKNNSLVLYWCLNLVMIFWFWDNFAATFLIDYLDRFLEWWAYILLSIIAIPAYALQDYFCKLSEKYWVYLISNIWLFLSWSSLFIMWLNSGSKNLTLVMILALLNSIWYASCMALSQAWFLESYNKAFARENNLKEIDSNASAAPLKIVWNIANVIWLAVWWIILSLLDFKWFFILFGGIILYVFYWTVKNKINYIKKDGK